MPHSLPPDFLFINLDSTSSTAPSFVLNAFELVAAALKVPSGTEYLVTKQPVLYRPVILGVDGMTISHFTTGPIPNRLWGSDTKRDRFYYAPWSADGCWGHAGC